MKATATAPSNIAFIKYWGKKDENLKLPENGSLSMNLSDLSTTTTVEFSSDFENDEIIINGKKDEIEGNRAVKHLDRIRILAGTAQKAKVVSENNFDTGTGLSSSASGFAALSFAAARAAGLNLTEKELSILARQGSGSACRSIPDGFVEWLNGNSSETSYAVSLFSPDWWDIADIVVVVNTGKKEVSTTEGMKTTITSPFFKTRLDNIKEKILTAKKLLKEKNFISFGELVEAEALELHAIMLTSNPSLIYWTPGTLKMMKLVKKWRKEDLPVYFTINTGQDIHLIVEGINKDHVVEKLKEVEEVRNIIVNKPAKGARLIEDHLF